MAKRGVLLDVEWDRSKWDKSYHETRQILGNMQPIMDEIAQHMETSIKQTLKEGGPPGKPFKPVKRGGVPLVDTSEHIYNRIFARPSTSTEARVGVGFEFAYIHQFGSEAQGIAARPFMVFRPEDPEKITGIARDAVEAAFGKGAGAFWGLV